MKVAVVRETFPGERRVALVPDILPSLTKAGWQVLVEAGAGTAAGFEDAQYQAKGAEIIADRSDIFKIQLRALLRAAVHGNVKVMLPMVSEIGEVERTKALIEECAAELTASGTPFARFELGVMIETPAAVLIAPQLARHVAFFSIGTNDLVQYTLAVDRGNASLVTRYTPLHPAVLRLIARTAETGRTAGLEVSVCGEMASQPLMAYALVGLGIRTLSVAGNSLPALKRIVRGVSSTAAAAAAQQALAASTAREAEVVLRRGLARGVGDRSVDSVPDVGSGFALGAVRLAGAEPGRADRAARVHEPARAREIESQAEEEMTAVRRRIARGYQQRAHCNLQSAICDLRFAICN